MDRKGEDDDPQLAGNSACLRQRACDPRAVSFETNVLRNRIWYRGDACELDQLFKLLGDDEVSRARFWAAAPEDESIRKAHSGLPGIM